MITFEILQIIRESISDLEIEYIYSPNNIKIQNKLLDSLKNEISTCTNILSLIHYSIKFLLHPILLQYILSLNDKEIDKNYIKEILEITYIRIIYNDISYNFPKNDITCNICISILDEYGKIFNISYNKISYKSDNLKLSYNYKNTICTEILYIFLRISQNVENIDYLLLDINNIINKGAVLDMDFIDIIKIKEYNLPIITAIDFKCNIKIIETLKEKWYDPSYTFEFFHYCRCNRYDNIIIKSNIECYISDLYKNDEEYYNTVIKLLNIHILEHEERMQFICSPKLSIHNILTEYFQQKNIYIDINSLKYVDE